MLAEVLSHWPAVVLVLGPAAFTFVLWILQHCYWEHHLSVARRTAPPRTESVRYEPASPRPFAVRMRD